MEYTKEDKLAFKKKDQLYARENASKCTATVFEGKEIDIDGFKEYADKIFDWLYQDQEELKTEKQETGVLPTPTQAQMKILEAIASKVGGKVDDDLKVKTLAWAFKVHSVRKYPENISSVAAIVDWMNQ